MLAAVTLVASILAQGALAHAGKGHRLRRPVAAATSLQITYDTRSFRLHYTLRCDPPTGTLERAAAACAAIARHPIMVRGEPPELGGPAFRSCPLPRETVHVSGTYRGAPAAADGGAPCGGRNVLEDWQPFLPSVKFLDAVRADRGAGPLQLGEARASVRSVLGTPSASGSGADVYVTEGTAIDAQTPAKQLRGLVREMLVVGYGGSGTVTTIISNWLAASALSVPSASPLHHPRTVLCAGRSGMASRPLDAPGATTILWPSAGNATVIITSASRTACRLARATEQPVVSGI